MNPHEQAILIDSIGQLPQYLAEGLLFYVAAVGVTLLLGFLIWRR